MNSCGATMKPPSPWTGSTTIAATVSAATWLSEGALERGERVGGRDPPVLVRERHAVDLGRERTEPRLVGVRLRREREREERPPVEAALEGDHGGTSRVRARELDRVLDGFGARVEERRLRRAAERRQCEQPLGERDVDLVRDDREVRVHEAGGLLLDGLDHVRVRVADGKAADAAGEVEERVAVDVRQRRAAALGDDDRQVERQRVGDHAALALDDRAGAGPRNLGAELDRPGHGHSLTISDLHGCIIRMQYGRPPRCRRLRASVRRPRAAAAAGPPAAPRPCRCRRRSRA